MEKQYRKYAVVMILCFLLGGFSIVSYLLQVYSIFWHAEIVSAVRVESGNFSVPTFSRETNGNNLSALVNRTLPRMESESLLLSPFSLLQLFTGVASLVAGLSIWNLIREREIKSAKKMILDVFLLPEEKDVMNKLEKSGGALTQSEIVRTTGLSRVKVHRIVKKLEQKKLVIKQQYGMTNKIALKK
jgi:hypothetical protein